MTNIPEWATPEKTFTAICEQYEPECKGMFVTSLKYVMPLVKDGLVSGPHDKITKIWKLTKNGLLLRDALAGNITIFLGKDGKNNLMPVGYLPFRAPDWALKKLTK